MSPVSSPTPKGPIYWLGKNGGQERAVCLLSCLLQTRASR